MADNELWIEGKGRNGKTFVRVRDVSTSCRANSYYMNVGLSSTTLKGDFLIVTMRTGEEILLEDPHWHRAASLQELLNREA